ncbi:MAG: S8 family serine peptidase [Chloroflexi bacterium]|uniref:S8 family peptidase n=1 Tax=Candidatus Chlorohelix allophototropha TaxID=3003348 RepID=A0A8T7M117_9CHLR|nr:S8 family serine peptidase [Chloroflexota bacterium]WJW66172.1 S8 family peptidase [Chloroflexota bacterium L227-S17]
MPDHKNTLSIITIVSILLSLLLVACGADNSPTPSPTPPASESKIDTVLLGIVVRYATTEGTGDQKLQASIEYARGLGLINARDEIAFELELDKIEAQEPVTTKISAMGGKVAYADNIEGTIKLLVRVPVKTLVTYVNSATKDDFLRDLAQFNGVTAIKLLFQAQPSGLETLPQTLEALQQVGFNAKNEGVKVMGVDKWHTAGFKGKGVRIGVIDAGFKYYKDLRGTYLPPDFQPVDIADEMGNTPLIEYDVHGTGTAEIIYSLAPEATMIAAAMDGNDLELSRAIDYMVEQKVQIISMSVRRNITAGDGNGPIDRKIERLRAEKGIMFIASAGNEAQAHYAANFNPDSNGFHQFLPGVTRIAVSLPKYSAPYSTPIVLNWEQWYEKNKTDLDLYAESEDGKPLYSSQNDQRTREPLEWVPAKFNPGQVIYLKIRLKPGTQASAKPFRLHLFTYRLQFQFYVQALSVGDPASSRGALAVGAVEFSTDTVASYSSQGPLVTGVFKPEISGPTNVSSAAYQQEGVATFGGTSASCPEVSGLAVVIKGANPTFTPDQLTTFLLQRAKDLGPAGPDLIYGYGRATAGEIPGAAATSRAPLAPSPTPNLSPDTRIVINYSYPTPPGLTVTTAAKITVARPSITPTVVISPTTIASPTPQPTPAPLVADFRDDFKSVQTGLTNQALGRYVDGQYQMAAAPNQLSWSAYPLEKIRVGNFAAEVNAEGLVESKNIYGLVFWLQSPDDYYLLSVSGDGMTQISHYTGGSWVEIMPWNSAYNWQKSASNLLRIVANSKGLQVFVNNRAVNNQPVKAIGSGGLGLATGSYNNTGAQAIFSNFQLSYLPGN